MQETGDRTEEGYCLGEEREEAGDREQRKVTAGAGKERQETENRGRSLLGQGEDAGDGGQNRGLLVLLLGQGKRGGRRQRTEDQTTGILTTSGWSPREGFHAKL